MSSTTESTKDNQVAKRSMLNNFLYSECQKAFNKVGITINGDQPHDIRVKDDSVYLLFVKYSIGYDRIGVGEAYMDNKWESDDLVEMLSRIFKSKDAFSKKRNMVGSFFNSLPLIFFNMQNRFQARQDISNHYDIGNDLFKNMLDRSMNYSCGYWQKSVSLNPSDPNNNRKLNTLCETLEEAQINKMLLIGRKLKLEPGMKILDIGCGWGYLAKFLAINFGCDVVGVTISEQQYNYATTTDTELKDLEFLHIPDLDLPKAGKYEFRLQDYREVDETFDRIVSVGMIEHVGKKNYSEFFDVCKRCLKREGLLLLHTIGLNYHKIPQVDVWVNKYIFPGGMLPYHTQLIEAFYGKFVIEDWHNFGYDYYRTLIAWHKNFIATWPEIKDNYSERFKRMWTFYLLSSATIFRIRTANLWQIVLSVNGFPGGYASVR